MLLLYWSWRVNKSVTKLKAFFKIFVGANLLVISTLKTFVQDKCKPYDLVPPPLQSLPFPPRQSVQVDVRAVCADVMLNFIVF